MKRFPQTGRFLPLLAASIVALRLSAVHATTLDEISGDPARNLAHVNSGAEIECTAPDGHILPATTAADTKDATAAVILTEDAVSCPLARGETTFVIKLPTSALLERFAFVNENAAAAGQLKIAVSNFRLPANSPDWVEVDGSIAFTSKRLFNLSMVGVEARYVKLTFNVVKPGRIASLGLYGGEKLERFAWR